MKDWYEFNKEAVKYLIENPVEAIVSTLFIGGVFALLYVSLWIFCPC
jgi:esterase/lipase|tara:strand:+ start:355 stop:495 length:141 start_codon:yes stop_codon:yes gene_type:complete